MTLVAGLSFGGTPAFVGDLLLSSRLSQKIRLPTRRRKELAKGLDGYFPAGLAQKLLIVRPYLLIAWAGASSVIESLVCDLNNILPASLEDFYGREDDLLGRLDVLPTTVEVVALVLHGDSIVPVCVHTRGFEVDQKRFYLLGTGNKTAFEFLLEMTKHMPTPDNWDGIGARSVLMNFVGNALMAQMESGVGLSESWGGGFEVAYATPGGFAKVDNILVRCWRLNEDGSLGAARSGFLIHYQGSTAVISSFGNTEKTTIVRSPIEDGFASLVDKEIIPEWTIDLFHRASDGQRFHAVQMEFPWSNNSKFSFCDGNIVGWEMEKGRVESLVEKIKGNGPFQPFQTMSF